MITLAEYFGRWVNHIDATEERKANARALLASCELLENRMLADGFAFPTNPATGSGVSGSKYGGFRPQDCPIGAPKSNHKIGLAVDRFDPLNQIDEWCMEHQDVMKECGIWLEHPSATDKWSHWQAVRPGSGNRVFYP